MPLFSRFVVAGGKFEISWGKRWVGEEAPTSRSEGEREKVGLVGGGLR